MADKTESDERADSNGSDPDPQAPAGRSEEFSKFEDLARRLVQVPKAELDAKRKATKP